MMYIVPPEEYRALLACEAAKRYFYFLNRTSDWGEVWGLEGDGGWALVGSENEGELVPFWPAMAFAAACCTGKWLSYRPQSILVTEFVQKWLPGMIRDRRKAAVFPLPDGHGIAVTPEKLLTDMTRALSSLAEPDG